MPKKITQPKEDTGLPEGLHIPEGELDGIIISEEVIEVEITTSDELEDEEDFDSIFSGVKHKRVSPEEEEDFEDFNSYFFEE